MAEIKITLEQFKKIREGEWFEFVDFEETRKHHAKNIAACKKATKEYFEKDRPLRILVVHGSGRSTDASCAYEMSNSQLFLNTCLEAIDDDIEVDVVNLREYNIEPCNACVSTCSALCNFPCTCFPLDPMQELYPKMLRSDILFCSTPVNQSTMSTRLKAFCDRLVSLDGGFFITEEQYQPKVGEYKEKLMNLVATNEFSYDQRLFGRVGAYFISSKDELNPYQKNMANHLPEKDMDVGFVRLTAYTLKDGFEAYGFFHHENYYAYVAGDPDIDYMYDKDTMQHDKEAIKRGKQVVRDAITKAKELKKNPPKFKTDRYNRT